MAGMRDVAKLAGVSLSTVSVVLNDTGKYVSEEQRKKVYAAAEALEYRLPPKKRFSHKTIAVILPVITSSFFSNLFSFSCFLLFTHGMIIPQKSRHNQKKVMRGAHYLFLII